jgi:alpha-tubulin suppressor-like RCC1 family protein
MFSCTSWTRVLASVVLVLGAATAVPETASAGGLPPLPDPGHVAVSSAKVVTTGEVSIAASPTYKASSMSAGWLHTCAATTKGAAICWGYNGYGQLGDNTTTTSSAPVGVYGLDKGIKAVTGGYYHSCALTTKGKVRCWGYNAYGELGDGTTTNSLKPVTVAGLAKAKAVSAGFEYTCALTTKGKVWCWGYNSNGQLGNNTTTNSAAPVAVQGLGKVKAISTGVLHACALTTKGKVLCWGYNGYGQLGDNTTTDAHTPVAVYGLTKGAKAVSAGYYTTCAVSSKGAAKCWGYNANGQLGNGTTTSSYKPVTVTGLSKKVSSVKPSYVHSCAVTTKGVVKCWGYNAYGSLGDNSTTNSLTPVSVYNLGKSGKVSLGEIHTCALTSKKAVKCWGYNSTGQLGDGTTADSHQPVKVKGF